MALNSFTPSSVYAKLLTLAYPKYVPATEATAAAVTMTVAQVLGGLILRDPNGAARADLLPTAELLRKGINGCEPGTSFRFHIRNTADAAEAITVTTNTGWTLSGTMTIAQNNTKEFLAVCTASAPGSEAFTLYSLGTFVH